jgi:hypothetical protein
VQLPFTKEQFFDLLAAYNAGLWPALIALWIASVLVCVLLLSSRRPPDRWIATAHEAVEASRQRGRVVVMLLSANSLDCDGAR